MDLEILSSSKMNVILRGLHMKTMVQQLKVRAGPIWRSLLTERKEQTSSSPCPFMAPLHQTSDHRDFHNKLDCMLFERNCVSLYLSP